jgi:hypothetical protein
VKLLKLSATRFFSLKGPGLPRQYYEEKLKEILQFCNKEKSLKTQLRMFSVNFSKQKDTNIDDDVIEHFMSMPSSLRKLIFRP